MKRALHPWLYLALVALTPSLCACISSAPDPDDLQYDPSAAPDPSKHAEVRNWQNSWDKVRASLASVPGTSTEPFHRGEHLSLSGFLIRSEPLGAPTASAAEVLIVVDGLGVLTTDSGSHALEPGTVAVLAAGARKRVVALSDELSGILLRSQQGPKSPTPTADRVLKFQEVFPEALDPPKSKENFEHVVGVVPDQITARAISVGTLVGRHMHANHDEFLFVVRGWGTMGLGSQGDSRQFASYPLRERSLVFVDPMSTHGYRDEEGRTLIIAVDGGAGSLQKDTIAAVDRNALDRSSLGHRAQVKRKP